MWRYGAGVYTVKRGQHLGTNYSTAVATGPVAVAAVLRFLNFPRSVTLPPIGACASRYERMHSLRGFVNGHVAEFCRH